MGKVLDSQLYRGHGVRLVATYQHAAPLELVLHLAKKHLKIFGTAGVGF